ncbi:uncharacterized protein LOC136715695 [Amia ocellicauda]|uniref:uncharacterized protein LOC136715695 n=1 Tax=Amia ocellicauda TaxID=2972642 RepID=UPI003463CD1B
MPHYSNPRRYGARRRSNSTGVCILPSIPEYPGFQDIKVSRSLPLSPNSSPVLLEPPPKRSPSPPTHFQSNVVVKSLIYKSLKCQEVVSTQNHKLPQQDLGNWPGGFHEQNLEDYFNARLTELRNPDMHKRPSGRTGLPRYGHSRQVRRRNSCTALLVGTATKDYEHLESRTQAECDSKVKPLSVFDFYKRCKIDCWNKINSWRVFKS